MSIPDVGQGAGSSALAGITVLDLSSDAPGQFCARLFADNGADVTLVEPLGGTRTRALPPLLGNGSASALFLHLNAGKVSRSADLGSEADWALLLELAASSDVVVVDERTPSRERLEAALAESSRPTVLVRISPYGVTAGLGDRPGGELAYQAAAGIMHESGDPEDAPLYGVGRRASYAAGAIGYFQAVAGLLGRGRSAASEPVTVVDVAVAEVAASMCFCRITQYSYNGQVEGRDARSIPRALVRCSDGWVSLFIYDHRWQDSCRALGLDDLAVDPRFQDEPTRLAHWDEFTAELDRRFADHTRDEIVAMGQAGRAVVAQALRPEELRDDPQLLARDFWRWSAPERPRLGPMFRFTGTPQTDRGAAPEVVGPRIEAAAEARQSALSGTPSWRPAGSEPAGGRPLDGLRVLDLTTAWSGPMATRLLASLGADVVKVEGPTRMDDWRGPVHGGLASRYPDYEPGEQPYDRCYQFNTQNHDKRDVVLDLKTEQGLEVARDLARQADVLIANFSAGTLERMGLGYEELSRSNPRLVVVEMPAYGTGGPYTHHVALGPSMELMSGMAALVGYGDGRPVTTGPAYLDPIGGFNSAAAVVTAVAAREHTGLGQRVEVAQREAAMHWIGEEIVAALTHATGRAPQGNRSPDAVPHNAFRTTGVDQWVALATYDDDQFTRLSAIDGLEALAGEPSWRSLEGRQRDVERIESIIGQWSAGLTKREAEERLVAAGVPAAAVADAGDLAASAFLRSRGLVQQVKHPAAGDHEQQGVPLHISGADLMIREPAPCFGQHTREVLAELGRSPAEIDALFEAGIATPRPMEVAP